MRAAGARSVVLPIAGCPSCAPATRPRCDGLRAARPEADGASTRSARRARTRTRRRGVVDAHLRVHGAAGVHVADGSAVPGPLGVNPQITIMALATRLAGHLLADGGAPACRS